MGRGIDRERQLQDRLESDDYWVARAAGSLGAADLVALKPGIKWLIEVKATKAGPYHGFGPKKRARLSLAAKIAGAEAWLCWWPAWGQPAWIPEKDWPR